VDLPVHAALYICAEFEAHIKNQAVILSEDWRVFCANRSRKPALSEVEGDLRLFFIELLTTRGPSTLFPNHHTRRTPVKRSAISNRRQENQQQAARKILRAAV
jgi:hypothetical protein